MFDRHLLPRVVVATVVVAVLGAPAGASEGASPEQALHVGSVLASRSTTVAVSHPGPQSAGTLALNWGDIESTPGAWKGNYAVLQTWDSARIAELKQKNPGIKILMYKDVAAVRKDSAESGEYSTGLSYREAAENGWLLEDGSGQILEWSDWAGLYPTDVGSAGYQARWGRNVLDELRAHDWDGVMMDDVLTTLSHSTVQDRTATKIPSNSAMYAATGSFLSEVGRRIKRAGFLAVPNLTVEWDNWHSVMADWTRYVSGWENEYFVKWGLGKSDRFVGADWRWKMRMAAWCAQRGVPLLAITYSTMDDHAAQTYHRATWLLTWNGRTGSSIFVPDGDFTDHWLSRPATRIGRPIGARHVLADTGVYRRDYTGGVVLVNPTGATRTVSLGGVFTTLSGREVSQVTLRSATGVLLRQS
jgi:hypothetical protein